LLAERRGILAWCVRGCLDWQQGGLCIPDEVRAATDDYQQGEDMLAAWLAECCIVLAGVSAKASSLYTSYRDWCDHSGEHAVTQKRWGAAMTERGFERYKNNGVCYRGVALRADE
jgi:putative DNA primase/helicase